MLAVFGDCFDVEKRRPVLRKTAGDYFDSIRKAGGSVRVAGLPKMGIHGNSHMLIQGWLAEHDLYR